MRFEVKGGIASEWNEVKFHAIRYGLGIESVTLLEKKNGKSVWFRPGHAQVAEAHILKDEKTGGVVHSEEWERILRNERRYRYSEGKLRTLRSWRKFWETWLWNTLKWYGWAWAQNQWKGQTLRSWGDSVDRWEIWRLDSEGLWWKFACACAVR